MFSINFLLYFQGEFVNNQELLEFVIFSLILVALMFDSGVGRN